MLTKEVCQYCHRVSNFWVGKKEYRWTENDELWWEKKRVWCEKATPTKKGMILKVDGKPPENCPYYFEHQINQEREKCEF